MEGGRLGTWLRGIINEMYDLMLFIIKFGTHLVPQWELMVDNQHQNHCCHDHQCHLRKKTLKTFNVYVNGIARFTPLV